MAERGRYQFYGRDWDDYESLCEWFNWEIPERFNVTEATIEHWAQESPSRDAVLSIEDDGEDKHYTYDELQTAVSGCAAALADRGIRKGDRVAINAPQRVETLITHLATWKLGAVSVPLSVRFGSDALAYRLSDCTVEAAVVDESRIESFSEALWDDSVTSVDSLLVVGTTVGEIDGGVDTTDFWTAVEEATSTIEAALV